MNSITKSESFDGGGGSDVELYSYLKTNKKNRVVLQNVTLEKQPIKIRNESGVMVNVYTIVDKPEMK